MASRIKKYLSSRGKSTKDEKNVDNLVDLLKKFKFDDVQQAVTILSESQGTTSPRGTLNAMNDSLKESSEIKIEEVSDEYKARAMKVFNAADKDKSGTIDEIELYDLLTEMVGPTTLAEANLIYSEMDSNHSGTITFDEFLVGLLKYKWDTTQIAQKDPSISEWEIPMKEVKMEKKLGEGIFGTVFKGKWRGSTVAIKRLKNPAVMEELGDFKREISILGKLRHPNILLFIGSVTTDKENFCIITEFMDAGNLHDIVHTKKIHFEFKIALGLMKQIAFGLNYLHLSNIIHRDLKLANILVDRYYNVKLCDFGLSCFKRPEHDITEAVGSPLWRAPELLLRQPYNQAADIYSYVLCCWELVSFEQPYLDIEEWDQLVQEVAVQGKRPTIPTSCPSDLAQVFRLGWEGDAKRRPNCAQIIAQLERLGNMSSNQLLI